jgi:cell division protein FtsQ
MPSTRPSKFGRSLARLAAPVLDLRIPAGLGSAAAILLLCGSAGYGVVKGGHLPVMAAQLHDARNAAAIAAGFRIASVALTGAKQIGRDEILADAGVSDHASLLFLDAAAARTTLKANPWIADATVVKFYPGRLQISVTEREAFALWQKDGRLTVIAADGTVLEPQVTQRFTHLPLVVGAGAELKAQEFLALLDRHPGIRDAVRASILVAERRWNLRLKNGIDVRLPEADVEQALATLVKLDHDKKLLSRDIVAIDLRLADRVSVRLSQDAASAREEVLKESQKEKEKKPKRKGSDA